MKFCIIASLLAVTTTTSVVRAQLRAQRQHLAHPHGKRRDLAALDGSSNVEFFPPYPQYGNVDNNEFVKGLFNADGDGGVDDQNFGCFGTTEAGDWGQLQIGLKDQDATNANEVNVISAGFKVDFDLTSFPGNNEGLKVDFNYKTLFDECFGDSDVGKVLVNIESLDASNQQEVWVSTTTNRGESALSSFSHTFTGLASAPDKLELGLSLDYGTSTSSTSGCPAGRNHRFEVIIESVVLTHVDTGRRRGLEDFVQGEIDAANDNYDLRLLVD